MIKSDSPKELLAVLQEKYKHHSNMSYADAIKSIETLFVEMNYDKQMLETLSNAIISDYENKEREILEAFFNRDFEKIIALTKDLESSIRPAINQKHVSILNSISNFSEEKKISSSYQAWLRLNETLSPLLTVLRNFTTK
ncbi:MAG: hypothetical protein KBC84_09980 [Proteobacteria bacterium]|nr:hypothetical protein [Pseudomonadota bacterium]